MLASIALILAVGLSLGWLCRKIRLPSLFGMIVGGILLGPCALNLIDGSLLAISADIRRAALIVILLRAGLKLELGDLKRVGRPAVLMCFVPASLEIVGMLVFAPLLLGVSQLDALVMGAVIAAVSPAVIVPRMIRLIDERRGTAQGIPQMILAGASVDDVFVIVLFTTFTGLAQGEEVSLLRLAGVPVSILLGAAVGFGVGVLLALILKKARVAPLIVAVILLTLSFGLSAFEDRLGAVIPFASMIAVMAVGVGVRRRANAAQTARIADKFSALWTVAEVFLFVLVGASVSVTSALHAGLPSVLLIMAALVFRMAGVFLCLLFTKLNFRERLFCMIAYTPKATVQAAIGGLPLAMGLPCGELVLTVSVIAILLTAPLGAFGIDLTANRLLSAAQEKG